MERILLSQELQPKLIFLSLGKAQERRFMMDLVFVLAIIGFFGLCIGYAYAFDRI
ncbi:MAG: hypothetical protein ABSG68_19100 [Thermoguttaceae bacterium]|jgi:hypothetical protein